MAPRKITKREVDAAGPGVAVRFIWDSEVRGFGLKITPTGKRVYVLQARLNRSELRLTIGRHGSPWTPDQARIEALKLLGLIRQGIDPRQAKRDGELDITVSALAEWYFTEGAEHKKPSTIYIERGLAKRHIQPLLGRRKVRSLKRADIERLKTDIHAGKTAVEEKTGKRGRVFVKGGPGSANRTVALFSTMLSFAIDNEIRADNPAARVKPYKLRKHERFLSPRELAALGEALLGAAAAGENLHAVNAIRLLILTGARRNEILSMEWDWIDFGQGMLRLPDSKTGEKSIPLGAPALELLAELPRLGDGRHVFPSTTGAGYFKGIEKAWLRVRGDSGLDGLRLHDLRHAFASVGVSGGDSLFIVGRLLGHSQQKTTERYAHLADDPMKHAADRISRQIAAAMGGKEPADVVELKRKG